jgi:hypothetical protein
MTGSEGAVKSHTQTKAVREDAVFKFLRFNPDQK